MFYGAFARTRNAKAITKQDNFKVNTESVQCI